MLDERDESLLAVAMYLISNGEPKERVTSMLMDFGWDERTARFAIQDIIRHAPSQKPHAVPSLKSFVSAWLAFAGLILLSGDFFLILPVEIVWRVLASLSYAILIPAIFLAMWSLFSILWTKIDE